MRVCEKGPGRVFTLAAVLWAACPGCREAAVSPTPVHHPLRFARTGSTQSLLCALLASAPASPRAAPDGARVASCDCEAGVPACHRIDVGDDRRPALVLETGASVQVALGGFDGTQVRFAVAALGAGGRAAEVFVEVGGGGLRDRRWTGRLTAGAPWTEGVLDLPSQHTAGVTLSIRVTRVDGGPGDVSVALGAPRIVEPRARGGKRGPTNLLVYLVDTLRPDHLSPYGYGRDTSPVLRRLAGRGVVFENAYSTAAWTRPATASLLTGLYPRHHGVHSRSALPENIVTLAERMRSAGWSTWAFVANGHVFDASLGFDQGFDRFVAVRGSHRHVHARAEEVNAVAVPHLATAGDEPFFIYVHVADPHSPYDPPPGYRGRFTDPAYAGPVGSPDTRRSRLRSVRLDATDVAHVRALYDEDIRYQDAMLGVLLAHLERLGLADDTAVLVVSDHGEEFLEHGDWEHGARLFEEQIRIPFVLMLPGVPGLAGRRIDAPVQLVDVVPTVLAWLGLDPGPAMDGRDLTPLLTSPEESPAAASRPIFCEERRYERRLELHSLIEPPWKVIRRRHLRTGEETWTLYDLAADRGERIDRADTAPAVLETLRRQLLARIAASPPADSPGATVPARLDERTRAALEALGYGDVVQWEGSAGRPAPGEWGRNDSGTAERKSAAAGGMARDVAAQSRSMLRRPGPMKSRPRSTTASSSAWE